MGMGYPTSWTDMFSSVMESRLIDVCCNFIAFKPRVDTRMHLHVHITAPLTFSLPPKSTSFP